MRSEWDRFPCQAQKFEEMIERRDPLFAANPGSAAKRTKNQKPNKEETTIERGDPLFAAKPAPLCSDIPKWLQELRENLVDGKMNAEKIWWMMNAETHTPVLLMKYL